MSAAEILAGGGILILLMSLIEVSKIKINPWTAIGNLFKKLFHAIGNMMHGDIIARLDEMREEQKKTQNRLEEHIKIDDERSADLHRASILKFNTDLRHGLRHTDEDFNEVLYNIDCYERYCEDHPDYPNNRAVHAIMNIKKVYDSQDFLE